MANVLISYFSDYGEAMYEAIESVLTENGNNVYRININDNNVAKISGWGGTSSIARLEILQNIKEFKANVCLNFNHSLPLEVYSVLPKRCEICVIDADNPTTFWNRDLCIKNKNRYRFLGMQSYSKKMYERFLNKQLDAKSYIYFPPATVVVSKALPKEFNISFIGSNFYPTSIPPFATDFYTSTGMMLYDAFVDNYYLSLEEVKQITKKDVSGAAWMIENIGSFYVGQNRLKHLQQLTDLGLHIFSIRTNWRRMAYIDFDLAKCYDITPISTIKDNEFVYNSSKISINISHPQAKTSFSWRVMDIMASSACLLMEEKSDWCELFGEFLSKDVVEAIIYRDYFDLRQKALRLLRDEKFRKKCVKQLNNAIEQNGRWHNRFEKLQNLLQINLLDASKTSGKAFNINKIIAHLNQAKTATPHLNKPTNALSASNMTNTKVASSEKIEQSKISFISKIRYKTTTYLYNFDLKKRIVVFICSCALAFACLPLVDLVLKKRRRNKLLGKIQECWR